MDFLPFYLEEGIGLAGILVVLALPLLLVSLRRGHANTATRFAAVAAGLGVLYGLSLYVVSSMLSGVDCGYRGQNCMALWFLFWGGRLVVIGCFLVLVVVAVIRVWRSKDAEREDSPLGA